MHVLVTGGGGYLGCHLVPLLMARGHAVRLFDRFCFGEEAISSFASSGTCEVIRGDIRRLQEHAGLLEGIDAVVHLASLSNDPSCDLDPDMAVDVNADSTRELASHAVQKGVRRFILGSSCNVYGRGVFEILDEESPANPVSTFGETKLAAERAVLAMKGAFFQPVVARVATMYGWSPRMRFDLAVNQMVATALRNKFVRVFGGGNQWRPFIHVEDAARAFAALLDAADEQVSGQVFNVGDDDANYRVIDLANLVAREIGNATVETLKEDEDLRSYRVQFSKLRSSLGFTCSANVLDGIHEVADRLRKTDIDPFAPLYFNVHRMKQLRATPVDEGGEPIAAHFVALAKPCLGKEEEDAVLAAMRSGWLTSGPHIKAFEEAFAEHVAAPSSAGGIGPFAVAVSSCTAALHLCLEHLGVKPGDEVITSPLTWASTGNTILHMGAKVVFADICRDTLNIDPASIERAITERTRVIMPVHLAGQSCELDSIYAIANRHGIPVVEDAAHAMGTAYRGVPIGSYGDYACFSFYAIKPITTMEGGAITVRDKGTADRLRFLAANGMMSTAWDRYGRSAVASPAEVVSPGFKYAMGNVSAAMGVEQLKKAAAFKAARKRLAHMYQAVLSNIDEITLPRVIEHCDHSWHLFIIRLNLAKLKKTRDEIAAALRRENVGTGVHFFGLHLHRYYRETLGMKPGDLPEATAASYEILTLPLHPQITDKNVREVVDALKKVLTHARK